MICNNKLKVGLGTISFCWYFLQNKTRILEYTLIFFVFFYGLFYVCSLRWHKNLPNLICFKEPNSTKFAFPIFPAKRYFNTLIRKNNFFVKFTYLKEYRSKWSFNHTKMSYHYNSKKKFEETSKFNLRFCKRLHWFYFFNFFLSILELRQE